MSSFRWTSMLFVWICFGGPAGADMVSVTLELQGTMSESRGRFTLAVGDQGVWTLELDQTAYLRDSARNILKRRSTAKVLVVGNVRVRSSGNTLLLQDHTVRVKSLTEGTAQVKVTGILRGSPAEGRLEVNDVIREIQGQEIGSLQHMRKVLGTHRGKAITIVVSRSGEGKVIEGVVLRRTGVPLGINPGVIWTWEGNSMPAMEADEADSE